MCDWVDPHYTEDWLHEGLSNVIAAKISGDRAYRRELKALGDGHLFNKHEDMFYNYERPLWIRDFGAFKLTPDSIHSEWMAKIDNVVMDFVDRKQVSKNLSIALS